MFLKGKKGIVLIASYLVIVVLIILGSAFLVRSISEKRFAERERGYIQALYLAEAGLQDVIYQLSNANFRNIVSQDENNPTIVSDNLGNGSYSVGVYKDGNIYYLDSTGTMSGLTRDVTQSVVISVVPGVPGAFDYAAYVGGNLNTSGAEDLTIEGEQQEGGTELPTVDLSYYQSIADLGQNISGNHTFTAGTYSGIWYVDGNVTIDSNVTINGSVIATGNINLSHNSNITITATPPYPALVAEGNFQFQDSTDITVNGLIFVGADMQGNFLLQRTENITFSGTLIVAGNFNLQQSSGVTIIYDASIIENPPPGFEDGAGGTINITPRNDWEEI